MSSATITCVPPSVRREEARMTELRGLIERMGEINLTAIEESEESQKRFDFLTTQRADLESAISQLEAAIEKINRASRKRFRETFDAIDAKFREVYPRMFGGGRAHLSLTDESDLLETGVDIVANPPGKKMMQNIELLSGGEKALTAVSLLFAIFLVKPSPFCVLDEVDAPLDATCRLVSWVGRNFRCRATPNIREYTSWERRRRRDVSRTARRLFSSRPPVADGDSNRPAACRKSGALTPRSRVVVIPHPSMRTHLVSELLQSPRGDHMNRCFIDRHPRGIARFAGRAGAFEARLSRVSAYWHLPLARAKGVLLDNISLKPRARADSTCCDGATPGTGARSLFGIGCSDVRRPHYHHTKRQR